MTMREGERWICSNQNCRSEIEVKAGAGDLAGANPVCSCRSRMKKVYMAPKLRRIQKFHSSDDRMALTRIPV
jgi:hypothetical protein